MMCCVVLCGAEAVVSLRCRSVVNLAEGWIGCFGVFEAGGLTRLTETRGRQW